MTAVNESRTKEKGHDDDDDDVIIQSVMLHQAHTLSFSLSLSLSLFG